MPTEPRAILLVEDNPDDAELALRAFKKHNVTQVHWVKDGAEALEYLFCTGAYAQRSLQDGPVVVLLDLKLPKVDGIEVLRQVKADARTRVVPIVVMTSSSEDRDVINSYQLGVNSYVVKPVDFSQFSETVRQLSQYWALLNHPPIVIETGAVS